MRKGKLRSREATTRTDSCHAEFRVSRQRVIIKEGGETSLKLQPHNLEYNALEIAENRP